MTGVADDCLLETAISDGCCGDRKTQRDSQKLEEKHKKLDTFQLGEKKKQAQGGLVFSTLPPKNGKNKSQGDLFFPPFPPKTEKTSPQGTCCQSPLSHLIRLCGLMQKSIVHKMFGLRK